ncbi:hypothetical protein [Streptococcus anginosus]|uniref:hypothetical protein n=1 Tax=Streptococcus anginosus TaxID=1328 RepID=UPI001C8BF150|nr:hypothetical protein [Streptococcus anginosus]MBX9101120.1 hypothetical protein [Streptococcus anginosus]
MSKKERKELLDNIKNYRDLRIFSYDEDLKNQSKFFYDSAIRSVLYLILSLLIFVFFSFAVPNKIDSYSTIVKNIFFTMVCLDILLFVYFLTESLNKFLMFFILKRLTGKYKEWFSLFKSFLFVIIPLEFFWLFSLLWKWAFEESKTWQYSNWKLNLCVFILSLFMPSIQLYRILKIYPNYLMDSINKLIFYLLAISSIVTLIFSPEIIKAEDMLKLVVSWGIILFTLIATLFQMYFEYKSSKNEEIAQQIFQEQLLKNEDDVDYNRLVECYYYGSEKYKEKLLSTEKFLEVVVKNELKSLIDLKTYDDYRLYKAYKGRSYL